MPRSRRPGRLLRSLVTGALGVVVIAGILPAPAAAAPVPTARPCRPRRLPVATAPERPPTAPGEAAAGQRPSAMYKAWVDARGRHGSRSRRGGRVTVGFKAAPDDRWQVGGVAPVALPGRPRVAASAMARQPNARGRPAGRRRRPAATPSGRPTRRSRRAATPAPADRRPVEPSSPSGSPGRRSSSPRPSPEFDLAAASGPPAPGVRLPPVLGGQRRSRDGSTTTSSRRSPTSRSASPPRARSRSATATARSRRAGAAGRARA